MRGQNQFIDKQDDETKNILGQIQLVKFRQSKNKRKPIPVEKEKLYDENYELRNRIKELQQMNLKLRTKLTVAEKQKDEILNKAQQQQSSPQVPKRSHSGMYKMSHPAPFDGKNNITLQKQKHNQVFKKLIRDKDFQIERLRMELQSLKKTMKFTRLNELRYENDELIEQTKRLKTIIDDIRSTNDKYSNQYSREIDQLRRLLQSQEQKQKKNGNALKKKMQQINEIKQRLRDCQLKKVQIEKRLSKDIKSLKAQQLQLRSKLNQDLYLSKQCPKQECNKAKKDRIDFKKRIEQLQKELKGAKDQLIGQRKKGVQKQVYYQKLVTQQRQKSNSGKKQSPSKQIPSIIHTEKFSKRENAPITKKQQKRSIEQKQPKHNQRQTNSLPSKSLIENNSEGTITQDKLSLKINNFQQTKLETSKQLFDKSSKNEQSTVIHEIKTKQPIKQATEQAYDSDNTEKLLESSNSNVAAHVIQQKKDKKATIEDNKKQNNSQLKEKRNINKGVDKELEEYQQFNQQFNQDGQQYQKIQFEEDEIQIQKNIVKQAQGSKEKKKKKENTKKKLKNEEKPINKKKQNKKIESDEQILYQKQSKNQNEPSKIELKEIRQTLAYKFIAQRCDYEAFVQIIKSRNQKFLSVQQVMNILQDQPCILNERDIQIVTIYCFQRQTFTGQQALPVKDFLKKMKKFVGKIKLPSEQQESENIETLIHLIYQDQLENKNLRKEFGKKDAGSGLIGKQQFISVLKTTKVGSKIIETALAQIVYVSQDINHLNYGLFLNRFMEEVERTA